MADPTEAELKAAARKALAAGDTAAAKRLVDAARKAAAMASGGEAPQYAPNGVPMNEAAKAELAAKAKAGALEVSDASAKAAKEADRQGYLSMGWKPSFEPRPDMSRAPVGATEGDRKIGTGFVTEDGQIEQTNDPNDQDIFITANGTPYMRATEYPEDWYGPGTSLTKTAGYSMSMDKLANVGKAIAGSVANAVTVPGRAAAGEAVTPSDIMDTVGIGTIGPGLSFSGGAASAAKGAAKAAPLVEDVAAAERLGIPVMRTDVAPPKTFIGGIAQKVGEGIPVFGTGGARAGQQAARVEAAQGFVREYGADTMADAVDDVAANLLAKRGEELKKYTTQKEEVISGIQGVVPVPKTVAAIEAQIEKLARQKMTSLGPVIKKLEEFRDSLTNQGLKEVEANRKVIGEAFSGFDMGDIQAAGKAALSAIYGPLREDMGAFIKATAGQDAFNKWASANARLSTMAGELANSAFHAALSRGAMTSKDVRKMLFSADPADVKLLYRNLDETGKQSARTAVVQEALNKSAFSGDIRSLSADVFKNAMERMGKQIGILFHGKDLEAATGLVQALKLTERAGKAGLALPTGVSALPSAIVMTISNFLGGSFLGTAAALGAIGTAAKWYETAGVKSALAALAKAETQADRASALSRLASTIPKAIDHGAGAGIAQGVQSPDYEGLWKRYGQ